MVQIKLTEEEIESIAGRLDELMWSNFHDTLLNVVFERENFNDNNGDWDVSDEDIIKIKKQILKQVQWMIQ
tara:strand:+ start:1928 stop:2140 length:213 start_codon:yes stop_codon:yes gene_type:complete